MGFLEEVVSATRDTIAQPGYAAGLPDDGPKRRPSFRAAIERDERNGALVVEYKRVSPGRASPSLPPWSVSEFVASTLPAAPSAYSCLATASRFEGAPADVRELASATRRPVLFKDFVIDRRQLDVAARTGASAVLLIARLESDGFLSEGLSALAEAAHRRGLEVLLEFHGGTELSRAAGVPADVFGVNMRDLDTLEIDRATGARTLTRAREKGLRPLLGLSGVGHARDAARLWEAGADGILVGSAVARSNDPARFLSGLRRPSQGRPR